jgi:hypothetical protein
LKWVTCCERLGEFVGAGGHWGMAGPPLKSKSGAHSEKVKAPETNKTDGGLMDHTQSNTPEKSETRGFNDLQFRSAVRYVPRPLPRRRLSYSFGILFVVAVAVITYVIVRAFG